MVQELHGSDATQGGFNASTSTPLSDLGVPKDRQTLTPLHLQPGTQAKAERGRRVEAGREGEKEGIRGWFLASLSLQALAGPS